MYKALVLLALLLPDIHASAHERTYTLTDLESRSYQRTRNHKRSNQKEVINPTAYATTTNQTSINPFSINVQCTLPGSICSKIQKALQRTLSRVAQVIYLPTTVNIQCTVSSAKSSSAKKGARSIIEHDSAGLTVLASAAPSRMVQFTPESARNLSLDANYLYPSALAKQYQPGETVFNSGDDVNMNINGDVNWWYWQGQDANDEEVLVGSVPVGKVYDLEQIALHELMHGLGFVSGWFNWIPEFPTCFLPGFMEQNNKGGVVGLSPLYIFDKYLIGVGSTSKVWMGDYAELLFNTTNAFSANASLSYSDWLAAFNASDASTLSKSLFTSIATTPASLWSLFQSPSSASSATGKGYAVLYTPSVFSTGSSISHVDANSYFATSDYLMRPFGTSGVGIEGYSPVSAYGPVGNAVLQIMRTMGYATALGPL